MTSRRWPISRAWICIPVIACVFILWTNASRIQRIERVSEVGAEALKLDPASPTGYQHGLRKLIVPEQNPVSYQWIIQTQQMLARGDWRLRHVTYDNAPLGRDSHNASVYRWWLGLVAKSIQLLHGGPIGTSVEAAALWAGPLLHILLLIAFAVWGARTFEPFAGALLALGLVAFFPLGGMFLGGQPDDFALSCAFALGSVLALLAGVRSWEALVKIDVANETGAEQSKIRRWFLLAGIAGGLGLWINARVQIPVLIGVAIGAVASMPLIKQARKAKPAARVPSPWQMWGVGGALTSLATYILEYFPSHLDVSALRLEVNHPLYALAWLGAGELIQRCQQFAETGKLYHTRRDLAFMIGALLALAAIPASIWLHNTHGFLATNPADLKLAQTADAPLATTIFEWVQRNGLTWTLMVTCLPVLALIPAGLSFVRDRSAERLEARRMLLFLGPVIALLIFACFRIRFFAVADAMLLVLMVAGFSTPPRSHAGTRYRFWIVGSLICFLPGLWMMRASVPIGAKDAVTELEAQSLVQRDLAHWLSDRGGDDPVVVLAPPGLTSSLIYFGALRGLATPYWENFDGFAAAVRIAGSTSTAEADSLIRRREVRFIVIPSWDSDLASYAALGTKDVASTVIGRLERWLPPLGLRPVAYKLPQISGFEGRSIAVFAATDMQDDALALSRLAEYFVEMGQLEFALRVSGTLKSKYPEDPSGLIAQAQVAAATNDVVEFEAALKALLAALQYNEDDGLPWDRRTSLAVVFSQAKRPELARKQLGLCLEEVNETLLRSLSTGSLSRLLVVMNRLNLEIPNSELHDLALQLLPPEMRAQVK